MNFHQAVKAFHKAFNHPAPDAPTLSPYGDPAKDAALRQLRIDLIQEEFDELKQALADEDITGVADALADIAYVVCGAAAVFGLPFEALFAEVQRSNMSKLGPDGKPIYRADGKILKGPDYSPPDLASILVAAGL